MKKFLSNFGFALLVLVFLAATAANLYRAFDFFSSAIEVLGFGSALLGMILLPFALFGVVQIVRGAISVLEKDSEKLDNASGWVQSLYTIASFVSYPAAIIFIAAIIFDFL